jgi:hypothetical protein
MMNDIQRRILAEAAKYGGANISVPDQMAAMVNEAPDSNMSLDQIVAEIKASLKSKFPKHRFSVRKTYATHRGVITVTLLSGPTAFAYDPDGTPKANYDINEYHPEHYQKGEQFVRQVLAIMKYRHYDHSDSMTDYFHTNFYMRLVQGDGRVKPFVLTDASGKKPVDPNQKLRPSNAWMGKTSTFKNTMTGKETIVAADNEYGHAIRFLKKETAQAFSDKYKLGGIIQRKRFYYVLINKPMTEEVEEAKEKYLTEGPYTVIHYPMIIKGLRDADSPFSIQFVDYKGNVLYQYPKQVNSIQALPAHMDGIFKEMRDGGWLLRHGGASLNLWHWHRVNILDKDGKVVNSIAAFDVPKKRSRSSTFHGESVEVEVSESKGVAFNVGSGAKRRIMSPNESVVGYYSIYAQYDSGEIELLLSKSDTVIGLEHYRMRMSNAKKIGRSGKLPKNFGGKPVTLDTLYQMIMAKVPDKSKAFGLQAQVMESMTEGTQFVEDGEIEMNESSYDAKVATAKQIAKRIKEEAQKRGVRVYPSGGDVLTATKEFTKGDLDAFMKAYRDCDMVLTYMRFTSRSNQWGCESAGFGVGAQECVKAGRVTINKSGGGGQLIIKALEGKFGSTHESVEEDQETVSEYRRRWDHSRAWSGGRSGYRSTSYSGDPRWITAKYSGTDVNGKPFKAGEKVLYFPNGKKFYTGAEAEKAWLEFLSAKGDEEGMPFAR